MRDKDKASSKLEGTGAEETEANVLASAIRKLEIDSIILSGSECWAAGDIPPSAENAKGGVFQMFVRRSGCGSSEDRLEYGFKVSCGIRLVPSEFANKAKEHDTDEYTLIEIKADFVALYRASEPLTEREEVVFHQQNAIFNVWPYWREFVQSTGSRMGVPYMHVKLLKPKRVEESQ